jgi:putative intracellular protease/amidase
MKTFTRFIYSLLFAFTLLIAGAVSAAADAKTYVCRPCGLPCDSKSFAAPGTCPDCGMPLVEAGVAATPPAANPDQKKVAILVFNGVEVVDFTGPYEMFGAAGCDVYTVASGKDAVTTAMGLTVIPKHTFADAPQPDVLVIPGGGVYGASRDEATLAYIKRIHEHTTHTLSVCNGAFILANTGLLDGLSATTTYGNIPKLASQYPKIHVVRDRRYVDNGKIITAAGLSAGIDGALHVIARLFGTGFAQEVALGEEVNWKPEGGFVRAALADHEIPKIDMESLGTWNTVRTEGDTGRWDLVVEGNPKLATPELARRIEQQLTDGKWTRLESPAGNAGSHSSRWRFTGSDGEAWQGTLKLDSTTDAGKKCTISLTIARSG